MTRSAAVVLSLLVTAGAAAHPGSGIVADRQGSVYVEGDDRRLWIPRVRKISPDDTSAVVVTVKRS